MPTIRHNNLLTNSEIHGKNRQGKLNEFKKAVSPEYVAEGFYFRGHND
jgi:hypothetical protein